MLIADLWHVPLAGRRHRHAGVAVVTSLRAEAHDEAAPADGGHERE